MPTRRARAAEAAEAAEPGEARNSRFRTSIPLGTTTTSPGTLVHHLNMARHASQVAWLAATLAAFFGRISLILLYFFVFVLFFPSCFVLFFNFAICRAFSGIIWAGGTVYPFRAGWSALPT